MFEKLINYKYLKIPSTQIYNICCTSGYKSGDMRQPNDENIVVGFKQISTGSNSYIDSVFS